MATGGETGQKHGPRKPPFADREKARAAAKLPRKPRYATAAELYAAASVAAAEVQDEIMRKSKSDAVRLRASELIQERAMGKVAQRVEAEMSGQTEHHVVVEVIRPTEGESAARSTTVTIEGANGDG